MASRFPTAIDSDGASIMDISRNQITVLNSTGGFVWDCLQKGMTVDEAVDALTSETGASHEAIAPDVYSFVNQLRAEHLFES